MKKLKYFSVILACLGVLGLSAVILRDGIAGIGQNITAVYFCSAAAFTGFVLLGAWGIMELISFIKGYLGRKGRKQV